MLQGDPHQAKKLGATDRLHADVGEVCCTREDGRGGTWSSGFGKSPPRSPYIKMFIGV